MFFESKLKKIFYVWIEEAKGYYKGLLKPYIDNEIEITDEEYKELYKELMDFYFKKATDFVKGANIPQYWIRWIESLTTQKCGNFEIDTNNINLGMLFMMVYYSIKGKNCNERNYFEFTHANKNALDEVLMELANN